MDYWDESVWGAGWMWFAFVDESGKPKFWEKDVRQEPLYVISAVVVHESKVSSLYHEIEGLKRMVLPRDKWSVEIHTKEIVHGNKNYTGVPLEKRVGLLDGLFGILSEFEGLYIMSVVVDKPKVLALNSGFSRNQLGRLAHAYAFKVLADMVEHFLRVKLMTEGYEFLLWVIDDSVRVERDRTRDSLIEAVIRGGYDPLLGRDATSFYTILPPLFAHSYQHLGLQVADAVSYVISRRLRGSPSKKAFDFEGYFQIILSKLYGDGLVVVSRIPRKEHWWM
ncbi:DUF3800 domain-containing protein [Thermococcus thioreducens]|uniref:DUF3800 domain-containing protein n=1 Tax=Thermococcus thioreducens TaxID=277988 RepID=UPI001180AF94|nr:DUF3800 domain-containing protein [Thermococcus thioreducens]